MPRIIFNFTGVPTRRIASRRVASTAENASENEKEARRSLILEEIRRGKITARRTRESEFRIVCDASFERNSSCRPPGAPLTFSRALLESRRSSYGEDSLGCSRMRSRDLRFLSGTIPSTGLVRSSPSRIRRSRKGCPKSAAHRTRNHSCRFDRHRIRNGSQDQLPGHREIIVRGGGGDDTTLSDSRPGLGRTRRIIDKWDEVASAGDTGPRPIRVHAASGL